MFVFVTQGKKNEIQQYALTHRVFRCKRVFPNEFSTYDVSNLLQI